MLSSPLQWPLLAMGVFALALLPRAAILARERDARPAARLVRISNRLFAVALLSLLIVDVACVYLIQRTAIVGFYYGVVALLWLLLVWAPLMLRSQRYRSENGWSRDWSIPPDDQ